MAYHYSNPAREKDPHALPDVEVFYLNEKDIAQTADTGETPFTEPGWYYAFGFPGCAWDGEASGPFATEEDALAEIREIADDADAGTLADDPTEESDGE